MPICYDLDRDNKILHLTISAPTAIEDYQVAMPSMLRDISDADKISLLLEVQKFLPDKGFDRHDLGFYFFNEIKGDITRLAIVCPEQLYGAATELKQLIQNHGRPAEIFQSVDDASAWLAD